MADHCKAASSCILDHTVYTWNDEAVSFWLDRDILRITAPVELNGKELSHRNAARGELLVYGSLPVMISAQCTEKNCFGCSHAGNRNYIYDRYGKCFISRCVCDPWQEGTTAFGDSCYNILYNSIPYTLAGLMDQALLPGYEAVRLNFTLETAPQTEEILARFCRSLRGAAEDLPMDTGSYTRGHFKRGVE